MNDKQATPLMYATPQDFTAEFPRYVYRAHNGKETVQWREAALDMANDRARLVKDAKDALLMLTGLECPFRHPFAPKSECNCNYHNWYAHKRALLRELGEDAPLQAQG